MPFIYQQALQMGFFNYSLSIALMFLILAFWLHNREKFTPIKQLIFCILGVLMFFTHAGGLTLTIIILGAFWAMDVSLKVFRDRRKINDNINVWKNEAYNLIICFLPAVLLQLAYMFRKGLSTSPGLDSFELLKEKILHLSALVNLSANEEIYAAWMANIFIFLLITGILTRIFLNKKFNSPDVFFLLALLSIYIYFNIPNTLAGGSILSIRFQCIPYFLILFWFGSLNWHNLIRWITLIVFCIIGIGFIAVRQPIHRLASDAVVEYTSVRKFIPDQSTVLPLSYSHNGRTPEGEMICDKLWLFMHAADYIGTDKSMVLFGNYEANTGYFPIIWHWDRNPFRHLPVDGRGFEEQPPSADIRAYPEKSYIGTIDYVIFWCLDESSKEINHTINILTQLSEGYDHIYTSENGLALLYKRKDLPKAEHVE